MKRFPSRARALCVREFVRESERACLFAFETLWSCVSFQMDSFQVRVYSPLPFRRLRLVEKEGTLGFAEVASGAPAELVAGRMRLPQRLQIVLAEASALESVRYDEGAGVLVGLMRRGSLWAWDAFSGTVLLRTIPLTQGRVLGSSLHSASRLLAVRTADETFRRNVEREAGSKRAKAGQLMVVTTRVWRLDARHNASTGLELAHAGYFPIALALCDAPAAMTAAGCDPAECALMHVLCNQGALRSWFLDAQGATCCCCCPLPHARPSLFARGEVTLSILYTVCVCGRVVSLSLSMYVYVVCEIWCRTRMELCVSFPTFFAHRRLQGAYARVFASSRASQCGAGARLLVVCEQRVVAVVAHHAHSRRAVCALAGGAVCVAFGARGGGQSASSGDCEESLFALGHSPAVLQSSDCEGGGAAATWASARLRSAQGGPSQRRPRTAPRTGRTAADESCSDDDDEDTARVAVPTCLTVAKSGAGAALVGYSDGCLEEYFAPGDEHRRSRLWGGKSPVALPASHNDPRDTLLV